MKKVYRFLILMFAVLMMISCGDNGSSKRDEEKTEETEKKSKKKSKKSKDEDEEETKKSKKKKKTKKGKNKTKETDEEESTEEESSEVESSEAETGAAAAVEGELILIDNEFATVKVVGSRVDNFWGDTWEIESENKTDNDLTINILVGYANGILSSAFYSSDIEPGGKTTEDMHWGILKDIGVTEITQADLHVTAMDPSFDRKFGEWCTVYPKGQENAVIQTREQQEGDVVLMDNEHVKLTMIGADFNDYYYTVNLYAENKMDEELFISNEGGTVNGQECEALLYSGIKGKMSGYIDISYDVEDLSPIGVTEASQITEIKLPVDISKGSGIMSNESILKEELTFAPIASAN